MELPDDQYVVYRGKYLSVEFYFAEDGRMRAAEFYESRPEEEQRRFLHIAQHLADHHGTPLPKTMFNQEDEKHQIFAIKPNKGRYLGFFTKDGRFIITAAFAKQTQKLTPRERSHVKAAIARKNDYLTRTATGGYYAHD